MTPNVTHFCPLVSLDATPPHLKLTSSLYISALLCELLISVPSWCIEYLLHHIINLPTRRPCLSFQPFMISMLRLNIAMPCASCMMIHHFCRSSSLEVKVRSIWCGYSDLTNEWINISTLSALSMKNRAHFFSKKIYAQGGPRKRKAMVSIAMCFAIALVKVTCSRQITVSASHIEHTFSSRLKRHEKW